MWVNFILFFYESRIKFLRVSWNNNLLFSTEIYIWLCLSLSSFLPFLPCLLSLALYFIFICCFLYSLLKGYSEIRNYLKGGPIEGQFKPVFEGKWSLLRLICRSVLRYAMTDSAGSFDNARYDLFWYVFKDSQIKGSNVTSKQQRIKMKNGNNTLQLAWDNHLKPRNKEHSSRYTMNKWMKMHIWSDMFFLV